MRQALKLTLILIFARAYPSFSEFSSNFTGFSSLRDANYNIPLARARAIESAFVSALSESVKIKIPEGVFYANFNFIENTFLRRAREYVDKYKILSEGQDGENYSVRLEVTLNDELIYETLTGSGLLKTLDYIPSITYTTSLSLISPQNIKLFIECFVQELTSRSFVIEKEGRGDILFDMRLSSREMRTSSILLFSYVSTDFQVEAHLLRRSRPGEGIVQDIVLLTFRHEFQEIYPGSEEAEANNLQKICLLLSGDFLSEVMNKYYEEEFGLKTVFMLLRGIFNINRAKDFIEELKKRKGYIRNPKITSIDSRGIEIKFEGGNLFDVILKEMESGRFGPFRTEIKKEDKNYFSVNID